MSARPSPTPSRGRASSWARWATWRPSRSAGSRSTTAPTSSRWAWCCTRCCRGTRPFRRDTTPETLTAILKDDPPDLSPGVTPALERVVRRCLEKRREDRFHSAHDLGLALDLLSTTTASGTTPAARPAAAVPRREALLYGAASLALLASGLAGGVFLDRRLRPAAPALVPPADVQARDHPIGTLRTRRPDDPLRRALGRRPMPRAHRSRGQPRIAPARSARRERAGDLAIRRASRSRSALTTTGPSPTARWRVCRSPAVRRARCSRT